MTLRPTLFFFQNPIPIKQWKLELWLGYETSMRQYETETLLCCEISTKIIRTDTVLDQVRKLLKLLCSVVPTDVYQLTFNPN